MNKKLPYEEVFIEQMKDLPLPDEDQSWQNMSRLLAQQEKRKSRGAFLYWITPVIFVLPLIGEIFLMVQINVHRHPTQLSSALIQNTSSWTPSAILNSPHLKPALSSLADTAARAAVAHRLADQPKLTASRISVPGKSTSEIILGGNRVMSSMVTQQEKKVFLPASSTQGPSAKAADWHTSALQHQSKKASGSVSFDSIEISEAHHPQRFVKFLRQYLSSVPLVQKTERPVQYASISDRNLPKAVNEHSMSEQSRLFEFLKDPMKKAVLSEDIQKERSVLRRKFYATVSIGFQQQVPVHGTQNLAFGFRGSRTPVTDYIPSLSLKVENNGKWFLQGEFAYASPQLEEGFSFYQQTRLDNVFTSITTRYNLKKTFNTQVPLSFNYYLLPGWSVGAGGVYSRFCSAVTEQEIITRDAQTQHVSFNRKIIPITRYTDSFLYRSHTYVLLQSQITWRRLSVGLRYLKDVQPYIKYTLPDGTIAYRRNWSLEGLLRLQLWRSHAF